MIINVYIDGFNFYYRAVKGTGFKWLDLRILMERSFPSHSIHRIKYFTADVKPRPHDPDQPNRQKAYLNALQTLPNFTIYKGTFKDGIKRRPLAPSEPGHPKTVAIMYSEEKGSDVYLATEMLADAFRGDFEAAIVVSDDSDLIPPVNAVRQIVGLPVGVLNPAPPNDPRSGKRRLRNDLRRAVTAGQPATAFGYMHLNVNLFPHCLLPDPVVDPATGRHYFKPGDW